MPRKVRNRNSFHATFSGYRTRPGQLAVRVPAAASIEIVEATLDHWRARWSESKLPFSPDCASSLEAAQFMVANQFDRQLTPWSEYAPDGSQVMPVAMESANARP